MIVKKNRINIVIGADHRGFLHKEYLKQHLILDNCSITWHDVGAKNSERSDYPVYAKQVVEIMRAEGPAELGIMICGSGIGMAIVANRYSGIYAAVAWNTAVARFAAEHDKVNVLSIPADFVSQEEMVLIVHAWLAADFLGGRYQKRIDMIDKIE